VWLSREQVGSVLAAVSLLLCAVTLAIWPWSYIQAPAVWLHTGVPSGPAGHAVTWGVAVVRGQVRVTREVDFEPPPRTRYRSGFLDPPPSFDGPRDLAHTPTPCSEGIHNLDDYFGFYLKYRAYSGVGTSGWLEVGPYLAWPSWLQAAVLAIAPILWLRRQQRLAARPRPGCCLNCGYDLRATPERCPECGRMVHPGVANPEQL
jgi:hypothetical protein